jgi:hypothetical protein
MSEMHLTADEQAQLDAMRVDDGIPEAAPPAAPAVGPAASPSPDPAAAEPPPPPAPKMVPLGALHEARELLKQERERGRLLEERTNLLLQRFSQPQPAPQPAATAPEPEKPQIPDLATDPVGHIVGTQQYLQNQQAALQRSWQDEQQKFTRQLDEQRLMGAITNQAQALERQFMLEHPDYSEAVNHLMAVRHKELEALGHTDPGRRQMILQQEGLQVAAHQIGEGRNPAAAIYELAKIRGFAPPPPAAAAPAAAGAGNEPSPEARLQNIAAGQQQSPSLGSMRGTGPAPLTAERLIKMSPDEFAKILDTPEVSALMGA